MSKWSNCLKALVIGLPILLCQTVYGIDEEPMSRLIEKYNYCLGEGIDDSSDSTTARDFIVYRISRAYGEECVEFLERVLSNDKNTVVRASAAEGLGYIGCKKAIKSLRKAMKDDPAYPVRFYAALALLNIDTEKENLYSIIYKIAKGEDKSNWRTVGFYMSKASKTDAKRIGDVKTMWQIKALESLEKIPTDEAKEILKQRMNSSNKKIADKAKEVNSKWMVKHSKKDKQ